MGVGERFEGPTGTDQLREAIARQRLVNGDRKIGDTLSACATTLSLSRGQQLIAEGGTDTAIYLVLVGSVQILSGGRAGPVRTAGECVGEMAALDIQAKRSASVIAREDTVVAKVSRADFGTIADSNPALWRAVAIVVTERLTQRLKDIVPRNEIPSVFIGSSSEGLPIAQAIQKGVACEKIDVRIWTDGVFEASMTSIEALEEAVRASDFALLVMTADDEAKSRGAINPVARDNVVFELGLFMGALGRHRTYGVVPRGVSPKVPTDLLGLTLLSFDTDTETALEARLGPVCTEIKAKIAKLGSK